MPVLKCKVCGADIQLNGDNKIATCQYCGSTMTIPRMDNEARLAAFNRGNFFRRKGEFDQALSAYERIAAEDNTDAEAHWCCALCRFGIDYVEDPNTYEWVPTCHRVSYDDFLQDIDYQLALKYSDGIAKRQYMKDAVKIAEVQKRLIAISRDEEAYDIFICYKENDDAGGRTADSVIAQDIYQHLADLGYKVFFSRITLEDKAGKEYEPYIFSALNTARIMLVVSTKAEYASAVWVKNEWSRFIALMRKDYKKILIPCYKDMDPYELPAELAAMQALDMGKIGAMQDLYRIIEKNLPADNASNTEAQTTASADQSKIESRLGVAFMNINTQKFEQLDIKFKEVLEEDITCARAYLGLLIYLDYRKEKGDTEGVRAEWSTYINQLKKYISPQMEEKEKKILTFQTAPALIKIYSLINDETRVDYVLGQYPQLLTDNALLTAICREGYTALLSKFIDRGLNVNTKVQFRRKEKNRSESLLFYTAAMTQNTEIAGILAEHGADACEMIQESSAQWPLLYYAIEANSRKMTEFLLRNGADPMQNVCYSDGDTYREDSALIWAVWYADTDVAEALLKGGAAANTAGLAYNQKYGIKENSYFPALKAAIDMKKAAMTDLLLRYGANPRFRWQIFFDGGYVDYSALGYAVYFGNAEIVKILTAAGADVNEEIVEYNKTAANIFSTQQVYQESRRFSPLYGAVSPLKDTGLTYADQPGVVELLLSKGANPNWAFTSKGKQIFKGTIRQTLGKTLTGSDDKFPILFRAINSDCPYQVIQLLMQHGASMDALVTVNGMVTNIRHYPFRGVSEETMQAAKKFGWKGKRLF